MAFNANRLKVLLKLSINRLQLLQAKKSSLNAATRKELAALLERGKEESARIRVEHVIREDLSTEALELLELYCDQLLARFGILETMKHCDPAVSEAVNSIIYAGPRMDVKELSQVREMLIGKYGRDFAISAMENRNDEVNSRIVQKLGIQTPDVVLVNEYLKAIAKAYNVEWEPSSADLQQIEDSLLGGPNVSKTVYNPPAYPSANMPFPQPDNGFPSSKSPTFAQSVPTEPSAPTYASNMQLPEIPMLPPAGSGEDTSGGEALPDFDELAKRFELLKKRKT